MSLIQPIVRPIISSMVSSLFGDGGAKYGSELVINGDFATDTVWLKGDGWTISGGTANCDGTQNPAFSKLTQSGILTVGKTYKTIFTVSNRSAGSVRLKVGGTNGTLHSADGTYEQEIEATATPTLDVQSDPTFVGSIDNVSVKEVL